MDLRIKTTTVVAFPISPLWHSVADKKEGSCFSCLEDSQARQGEQHASPAPCHPRVHVPQRSTDPKVFSQSLAWKTEEAGYPGHCVGTQLSPIPPWSLLTGCYEPLSGRGRVEHPEPGKEIGRGGSSGAAGSSQGFNCRCLNSEKLGI